MTILLLLLSCADTPSGSGQETGLFAGTSGGGDPAPAAVYEVSCEEALSSGLTVPGIDGPAIYLVEECAGETCRAILEATRRDGDLLFAACTSGMEEVRVVLVK